MLQEKKNRNAMEKKRRSEQQRYVKWKRNNSEEGEKESETEGEVEGWEVDRQITTRLRLADSCESRIWYCSTNTQTRTYAGVDTHTHVCTYTHAHHHGLKGAHTHAHTIQKSHITHEILMVQSNRQKWRWVDRRKTQGEDSGGGEEREMDESNMSLLPVLVWHLDYQQKDIHGIITFSMSMFNLYKLLISFTGVLFIPSRYKGRSSRVLKCPNADWKWHNKYFKNAYIYMCVRVSVHVFICT